MPPTSPGIVLLAAGLGRRYRQAGGTGNKLMAQHRDGDGSFFPLFELSLRHALASRLAVQVVLRPEDSDLQSIARRYGAPYSLLASQGMGESIARGVSDTPQWQGWLIQPADMPHIRADDYLHLADALLFASQARLSWQGTPGHPVAFAASWRQRLIALSGDQGARMLLVPAALRLLEAHPGVLVDHDLPLP